MKINLNLGAGYKRLDGFISLDIRPETNPDYLTDFETRDSLAMFKDNSVDHIFISHLFEHINNIEWFMSEVYRVCKPNAEVMIISPYWSHHTAVEDPTHVRYLTEKSMMFFSKTTKSSDGGLLNIPYDFKVISIELIADDDYKELSLDKINKLKKKYLNVIKNINFLLRVTK